MKAKIDESGILSIERAGLMLVQHCAKRHDHYCLDICPLFGEPEVGRDENGYIDVKRDSSLRLCETTIVGEIADERGKGHPFGHPDHDPTCGLNNGDVICTCGKGN